MVVNKRVADVVARLRTEPPRSVDPDMVADLLERTDVLRPPCPTCDGKNYKPMITDIGPNPLDYKCPDCVDGRMSWERMAAIVSAVFDHRYIGADAQEMGEYLRSVRS